MRILITGGNSDIAQAIALRRVSQFEDEVILTASSEVSLQSMLKTYGKLGIEVKGLVYDFADPRKSEKDLDRFLSVQSGVDALVLNAAQPTRKLSFFHEIPFETYSDFVQSEINGNAWLLQKCLGHFCEKKFGRIVLISSLSAEMGTSRYSAYCTSKAALEGLMKNIAVDYGVSGIRANIVRPGIIATRRNQRFWKQKVYQKRLPKLIPAGDFGLPAQVAPVLDPLLESSCYCNGATFSVTGGFPMMRSEGVLDT